MAARFKKITDDIFWRGIKEGNFLMIFVSLHSLFCTYLCVSDSVNSQDSQHTSRQLLHVVSVSVYESAPHMSMGIKVPIVKHSANPVKHVRFNYR